MGCNQSTPVEANNGTRGGSSAKRPGSATFQAAASATFHAADMMKKGVSKSGQVAMTVADGVTKKISQVFVDPTQAIAKTRAVRNIFAKPLGDLLTKEYQPPVFKKTAEESNFIEKALPKNFVFERLGPKELRPLVDAFEKIQANDGEEIIKQGDDGDYFYIIQEGSVSFSVNGKVVGHAEAGASFGELALLYTTPRAATVTTTSKTQLFRVDHVCFRYILKSLTEKGSKEKFRLLRSVEFLKDVGDVELEKLASVMMPTRFSKGDTLVAKGEIGLDFFILKEGKVAVTDIGQGYEDVTLGPGDFFGERALVTGEPRNANIKGTCDGLAFRIDKDTFERSMGQLQKLILTAEDRRTLAAMTIIKNSKLDQRTLISLTKLIRDKTFKNGEKILIKGIPLPPALYVLRKGSVEVTDKNGNKETKESGSYFGDEQLLVDTKGRLPNPSAMPDYSVTASSEKVVLGVLRLEACRRVVDTRLLGKPPPTVKDSLLDRSIKEDELKRHKILGAGTFGQVWLVSRANGLGEQMAYALKIQSKKELIDAGQAKAVIQEKNIMAKLSHPFLIQLYNSYQDANCVYMLMQIIPGGELFSYIHTNERDGLTYKESHFFSVCIAEGLGYMHRRGYVYRDLKPENVMISEKGYPVIIDFGFAKYVEDKTFTLCGTPLYLAPEVILNRGHNWGADHWSMGVLTYEMLTGGQPFYVSGMQQMELFRAIVKGQFAMPDELDDDAKSILKGLLTRNPSQRLGNLAGGEDDILGHAWFAKFDFEKLREQEVKAPYVPKVENPLDTSHFENWSHLEDKSRMTFPKLKREQELIFAEF